MLNIFFFFRRIDFFFISTNVFVIQIFYLFFAFGKGGNKKWLFVTAEMLQIAMCVLKGRISFWKKEIDLFA